MSGDRILVPKANPDRGAIRRPEAKWDRRRLRLAVLAELEKAAPGGLAVSQLGRKLGVYPVFIINSLNLDDQVYEETDESGKNVTLFLMPGVRPGMRLKEKK